MRKIAFVFSGQGAQYAGMGRELYDNFDACKALFDQADGLLDMAVSELCFTENEQLNQTAYTQPCIYTVSMAALALMAEAGIQADYLAGFSLGEYSALTAGGVFSFADGLKLVRQRGLFMAELNSQGAMSAILGLPAEKVEEACEKARAKGLVVPVNYNMPGQTVIAGIPEALAEAEKLLADAGAKKIVQLKVSGPFHTELLHPAAEKLKAVLQETPMGAMAIPVATNVTGDIIPADQDLRSLLARQVMRPVLWEQSVRRLIALGADTFVELGPGRTLCSFIKKIDKTVTVLNVEDSKSYEKTRLALKG